MARSSLRRRAARRSPGRVVSFVSEGTVTEPEYVERVRLMRGVPSGALRYVRAGKSNPLGLVRAAVRERCENARAARSGSQPLVDEWWVLFDTEGAVHPQAGIGEAIALARREGIRVAMSDPSFEYWLLLHYRYTTREYGSAEEVIRDLREFMPSYSRSNKRPVGPGLADRLDAALRNAGRVRDRNRRDGTTSPMTDVDLFVRSALGLPPGD